MNRMSLTLKRWLALVPRPVAWLAVLITLPELVLFAADHSWLGTPRWRPLSYGYGAFWAGLLYDWTANFAGQKVAMFFSYSFLHVGVEHLLGNLAGLLWLGHIAVLRVGALQFFVLYTTAALGGAAVFGLLSQSFAPMVGASGALFGLAGAWLVWTWQDDSRPVAQGGLGPHAAFWHSFKVLAVLLALNIGQLVMTKGALAWQTHLGGFICGVVLAALMRRIPVTPPARADAG
jgi:membrane associated rhomboid family serine protease